MATRTKQSQPRVWERTLWAIQRDNGRLRRVWRFAPPEGMQQAVALFTSRRDAFGEMRIGDDKPVKVRERIEVIE